MRFQRLFLFLLLLLATLATARAAPESDDVKKEREKFNGRWNVITYKVDGKDQDIGSDVIKRFDFTFDQDKVTIKANNQERENTYTLDLSTKPKRIDLTHKGKTALGIYEFDGEFRLQICLAPEGEKKRPKEFVSKERTDVKLFTLRRVKQ
jgi:uncharacterized protein (TIGR03067 family)